MKTCMRAFINLESLETYVSAYFIINLFWPDNVWNGLIFSHHFGLVQLSRDFCLIAIIFYSVMFFPLS